MLGLYLPSLTPILALMAVGWGGAAAWTHAEQLLTRGKVAAQAIGAGATYTIDLLSGGDSELTVEVDMTGTAAGDLAVTAVPYEADNVTLLSNAPLPVIRSTGPTLGGGAVQFTATYDVAGVDKVRIVIKNNNVAGQTITRASWRLT